MKKRIGLLAIAMLFFACTMTLAACGGGNPLATQLPVPQNVRVENSTLHWDTVDNASNYLVAVDGVTSQTSGNTYSLSSLTEPKTYELKVKALGNTLTYTDSDWSAAIEYVVDDGAETIDAETPNITIQPVGTTYDHNATATALTVTASVSDSGILSYQWYSNTTNSTSGGTEVGTDSSSYTPSTVTVGTLYYYVAVANTNDAVNGIKTATVTSNVISITVNAIIETIDAETPNITTQPVGTTYDHNAAASALTVTATITDNGKLSYQWYSNTTNSTTGGTEVGADSSSFTPPTATAGTLYYYVVITNTNDTINGERVASVTSNVVAITVNTIVEIIDAATPSITTQPVGATYDQNAVASALTVTASVSDSGTLSYQWYSNTTNSTTGGTEVGVDSSSFTPPTATVGTLYYYVVITNTNDTINGERVASVTSNVVAISVIFGNGNEIVNATGFTFVGTTGSAVVSNATDSFSFNGVITVSQSATWKVYRDMNGTNEVPTRTISLEVGDNTVYILVIAQNGSDMTLYTMTVRRRPIYLVTFNTIDGTAVSAQNIEEDSLATDPGNNATTKTGYTFSTWDYDFNTPITDNTEIDAQWTAHTYTITYNANKPANASGTVTGDTASTDHTYDTAKNINGALSLTGWAFAGWKDSEGNSYTAGQSVVNLTTVDGDSIELFAQWTANTYTITYNANKPANASDEVTGNVASTYHIYDTAKNLNGALSLTGWSFADWKDSEGNVYTAGQSVVNLTAVDGDSIELFAQWTANILTISYNQNKPITASGIISQTIDNSTHFYDTTSSISNNIFTLTGWTFLGWNTQSDGNGDSYANQAEIANSIKENGGNLILYAQWTANPYLVTYIYDGATDGDTEENKLVEFDELFTLATPSNAPYSFGGWYTEIGGGGTQITDASGAGLQKWRIADNTTLYAYWKGTEGLAYTLSNNTYSVSKGTANTNGAVVISEYYNGLKVTSIGYQAFYNCSSLESVIIPASVTSIGYSAFEGCSSLVTFTIPSSLTSIATYAFYNCSILTSITIPISVTSIGYNAFYGCSSLMIYVEATSTPEGWEWSWNSSNRPVVWDCNNNDMASDGYIYYTYNGVVYALKDGVATVLEQPIKITSAIIESILEYKSATYNVTSIGDYAFYNCSSLTSITIPSSVTSIATYAFRNCSGLTSITIPSSVTSIGAYAFTGCSSLTIYAEAVSAPDGWNSNWNTSGRPVVWGCTLSSNKTYVVSFAKNNNSISNPTATNGIKAPQRTGYTFGGWATSLGSTTVAYTLANFSSAYNGTTLYAIWVAE